MDPDSSTNEGACQVAGDQAIDTLVQAIESGIREGSIRSDVGDPLLPALALWAFTHGIIQIAMVKGTDLARHGVAVQDFSNYAFQLLRGITEGNRTFDPECGPKH